MNHYFHGLAYLNEIALFSLLSLLIPIVVHIINPAKGKVVFVGSINFIVKASRVNRLELKLRKWLLLLVRLFILVVLALILANVIFTKEQYVSSNTDSFVTYGWLKNSSSDEIKELEKLRNQTTFYLAGSTLEKISFDKLISLKNTTKTSSYSKYIDLDALIAERSQQQTRSNNTTIYATNRLTNYSHPVNDYFQLAKISWRIKELNITSESNKTVKIHILYSETRTPDFEILRNTLNLINKSSANNIDISSNLISDSGILQSTREDVFQSNNIDWYFYLDDNPVPPYLLELVKSGSKLFADAENSMGVNAQTSLVFLTIGDIVAKFKIITEDKVHARGTDIIFANENNKKLLTSSPFGKGYIYQFNSRFNPSWNGLVDNIYLPYLVSLILEKDNKFTSQRITNTSEIVQARQKQPQAENTVPSNRRIHSPRKSLLLALCIFWLLERLLSEYRREISDE